MQLPPSQSPQTNLSTVKKRKNYYTPMADTYEDVKKLIYGIIHNHQKKYGGDFEELLAECNLSFIGCYNSYKPEKARFSTYVYWCTKMTLLESVRKAGRHSRVKMMETEDMKDFIKRKSKYDRLTHLKDLSDDASLVAESILNPSLDIKVTLKNLGVMHTPKRMHYSVRVFLEELGWDEERIEKAFLEIANNI